MTLRRHSSSSAACSAARCLSGARASGVVSVDLARERSRALGGFRFWYAASHSSPSASFGLPRSVHGVLQTGHAQPGVISHASAQIPQTECLQGSVVGASGDGNARMCVLHAGHLYFDVCTKASWERMSSSEKGAVQDLCRLCVPTLLLVDNWG